MRMLSRTFACMLLWLSAFTARPLYAQTLYVDAAATGSNNGSSWAHAYTLLSQALDTAAADTSVREIRVAEGSYYPAGSFKLFRGGLKMYGGYPSGGGTRNTFLHPTILDGAIGALTSSNHVVVIAGINADADSLVVDGFIIQNGLANQAQTNNYNGFLLRRNYGAGIAIVQCANGGRTVIRNCHIRANRSLCATTGMGIIQAAGSGMYINGSSPLLYNCIFSGNIGHRVNTAPTEPFPRYKYTLGNALYTDSASPVIVNCVLFRNRGGLGAIYTGCNGGTPVLRNSIVYSNSGDILHAAAGCYLSASNCITQAAYPGTAMMQSYPVFADTLTGDFRLQQGSPAVNAGNNAFLPADAGKDLWNGIRVRNGNVDLGVHEYGNPSLAGPAGICFADSAAYTGSPAGGSYSSSDTSVAMVSSAGMVTALGTGSVTITYTAGSDTAQRTIVISTIPAVAVITGTDSLCAGTAVTMSNATGGGLWSSSSVAKAAIDRDNGLLTGVAAGEATIGYTVTTFGCSHTVTKTIYVKPKPSPVINAPYSIICIGALYTMTAAPAGGTWTNSNPSAALLLTDTLKPIQPGSVSFTYSVTGANGCAGTTTRQFSVQEMPVAVITNNDGVLTCSPNVHYQWYLNGETIPGAAAQTYTPTESGSYTVMVRNNGTCTVTSEPYVFTLPVSVAAVAGPGYMKLYPNPVRDRMYVDAPQPADIRISTMDGRLVLQAKQAYSVHTGSLPAGVYIVTICDSKGALLLRQKLVRMAD